MYAEYIGVNVKRTMVEGMMLSGALGGLAGAIEVLGVYGYFLDGFSQGIAFDGMLAALIANNNFALTTVLAMFLAILGNGALSMQRYTGIPESLIRTIIATFILLATMKGLFEIKKYRRVTLSGKNNRVEERV